MKLLTKPNDFDFNHLKEYQKFYNFRFALTERNWTGDYFITKNQCEWFTKQLEEADVYFKTNFPLFSEQTDYDFLIDTSVFYQMSENENVQSFLATLSLNNQLNTDLTEKELKLQLRKLRDFGNRPENYVYLLKWCYENKEHRLCSELLEFLLDNIKQAGLRNKNYLFKESLKANEEVLKLAKKGMSKQEVDKVFDVKIADIISNCEQMESELFTKMFKHAFEHGMLFYYAVYFMSIYYQQMDSVSKEGSVFVTAEKTKKEISLFVKDSHEQLSNIFLNHESFLRTFPRSRRTGSGFYRVYLSLHQLQNHTKDFELEKIDVLKTIVDWVASRIPDDKLNVLPKKKWIHAIKGDLLKEAGLKYINFESNEVVGGAEGKELMIKAIADTVDGKEILFPVFDPFSWDNLSSIQCNLMAYAICLYHDICIENNYELIPFLDNPYGIEYELITKETTVNSTLHLNYEKKGNQKDKIKKDEDETRQEHWVSFHFRRLRPNFNASQEAKERAKKYGIKQLPRGFTFVDSFVRGERTHDITKMKISALDVLNRTFNKLNSYEDIKETIEINEEKPL